MTAWVLHLPAPPVSRGLRATLVAGSLAVGLGLAGPIPAQAQSNLLIHGNFCGPGNRGPGYPPVDALDLACARHDACSPAFDSGIPPTCACNRRLQVEASLVARDPYTPDRTREMARFISDFIGGMSCR